jgi:hypothetical protein
MLRYPSSSAFFVGLLRRPSSSARDFVHERHYTAALDVILDNLIEAVAQSGNS